VLTRCEPPGVKFQFTGWSAIMAGKLGYMPEVQEGTCDVAVEF
jgi:hypothetical protein